MHKDGCVFCKLVKGEIPFVKIWEDKDFLAILDMNPNTEGMALLLTKEHYDSYVFDMPDLIYKKFFLASKKLAKLMEQGLAVHRVALVMEGMGVNHAHIKLYPLHGLEEKFKETWAKEKIYFDNYPGYITTQLGPERTIAEREKVAEKIRGIKDEN